MTLQLPAGAGQKREDAILDHVAQGNYEIEWATIQSTHNGQTAEFQVFGDALKIDGVRVGMCARTEQLIADALGCMLLTPKLADLIWQQRIITLKPEPVAFSDSTQTMINHSREIDKQLEALGNPMGLKSTVGKHWVIDNDLKFKPQWAMNYGWHFEGKSFENIPGEISASRYKDEKGNLGKLIQGRGTRHNMNHSDYSQTCVLVSQACTVNGTDFDLKSLLQDPNLAPLASHQGIMTIFRQPGT